MLKRKFKYLSSTIVIALCVVPLCVVAKSISDGTKQSERGDLVIDHVACTLEDGRYLLVHPIPNNYSRYSWQADIGQGESMIKLRRGSYDYVEDGNVKMDYLFTRGGLKYQIHFDYDSFRENRSKGYIIIRNRNRIISRIHCKTTPKFWVE